MNFRTTAALFAAALVVGLGLLVFTLSEEDRPTSEGLVLAGLAGVKADEVDTVEFAKGDAKLVLKRTGKDKWVVAEPVATKADGPAVDRVISALLKARATAYPELSSNPVVHGLDNPGLRVTLRAGDKADTLNVGDVTIGGAKAVGFVTTPTRTRPMAVSRADLEPLFREARAGKAGDLAKWTGDFRTKQVFSLDTASAAEEATAIRLSLPNKKQEVALSKAGGAWKFDAPANWGDAALSGDAGATAPSAVSGVRGLLNTVVGLQAASGDDFIDSPGDLKEYGLNADNPDRLRVEIKPKDGPAEVAYIGRKLDPAPPAAPGSPAPPAPPVAKVYVQFEGSKTVVRVNPGPTFDGLAAVVADPTPLRDRDLLADSVRGRIDAIDLVAGGQTVKLRKPAGAGGWKLYGGPNDPQDANAKSVENLLALVTQPRVVKDFPTPNDAHFAGAELKAEVKLWADGVEASTDPKADPKAEPKLKGVPAATLLFGRKDASGVYVRRVLASGAKVDFLLPATVKTAGRPTPPDPHGFGMPPPPPAAGEDVDVLAAVARTRLDFLDPGLKSFSSFQANKLTIQAGATVTEVVLDKTPDPMNPLGGKWKFAQPAALKDRPADVGAVTDLLTGLATETMVRYVAEQATDAELAKWGLDPKGPRLKVTVGLDAGPAPPAGAPAADKERVYAFGTETDDRQAVYARQEGKPGVFTVRKPTYDRLAAADLRDKTVVRFDKAKAKKVTVKGWLKAGGFEAELVFERKPGADWAVVKSPGAYNLDPAKVERFLDAVNGLRAKAFLPGPPKPEQTLTPDKGGFLAQVEVEGGPAVVLFLGAPTDGEASVFAQASTLPANENVFTVPADVFKPYTASSAAFAK